MGEVYRARDSRLGREVAVKVLPAERVADESRRKRFLQEARAASALNHPHIVTIHEIGSADGIDFIVMEYIVGQTLDGLIPKRGMEVRDALRLAIPIADAVAAAHAKGIVHRDLKPANVIVSREGVVKVLDFGLAKLMLDHGDDTGETQTAATVSAALSGWGVVTGTAGYLSPEQAAGGRADARSDVFSFGAMLYEMVTGRRAFTGKTVSEILTAVVSDESKAPREIVPQVPEALERLIQRCLRKEQSRRVQHMLDVKVELQDIQEHSDSGEAVATTAPALRRTVGVLAGLVVMLALTAALVLLWRSRRVEVKAPFIIPLTSTPGREEHPTFSPDGNYVAFTWDGEGKDNDDIYIKMIGSAETRRLTTDPGYDGHPSWSPDGRQIAFVHAPRGSPMATIHLISPLGGPGRKLSDEPVAHGQITWSADGRWLATGASVDAIDPNSPIEGGIRFIDASTGVARPITKPPGSSYHPDPAFSPDGRHLAYFDCVGRYSCAIEVMDLGHDSLPSAPARRLTRRAVGPRGMTWARDSRSVVYADGINSRIWRVGMGGDSPPERIELAGFSAIQPAIASSRDRLVISRSQAAGEVVRFEEGRPLRVVASSSLGDGNPHFSPDGKRFAFSSARAGEGSDIWIAAADGTNAIRLTDGPGLWQGAPNWSPDGRRIAFTSMAEDAHWDVWIIDAGGGSLRRLTKHPADENQPSFSRDGRFVYFASNRTGMDTVWRVPAGGGPEEQVSPAGGARSQEAVDGRTLFFQRRNGWEPILALRLLGGGVRTVAPCARGWTFAVGAAGLYHLECGGEPKDVPLYLLDPTSGRRRVIGTLESPLGSGGLTVSPDGKTILYTRSGGAGADLMLIENFR
jgi:Tol biopolymer transport system component